MQAGGPADSAGGEMTEPPNNPLQPSTGGRCGVEFTGAFARRG